MMAADRTPGRNGELRHHESMAAHSSWRAGGSARYFYQPADVDDLCAFLAGLDPDEPLLWLGLGSNLLVRDGGFPGTVIATFGALSTTQWLADDLLRAASGVTCSKVARMTAKAGFTGLEFLAGIPGTIGGALAMNAGAFGGQTWAHVEAVETVDRQGILHTRHPAEYRIGYRNVQGPANEWYVAAQLRLGHGAGQAAQENSVFRNPPGDHAARLIEAAGLKGATVGAAQVSEQHANFIVNTGSATAADIEMLINQVQGTVEQQFSIRLEPEVCIIGDPPAGPGHE
jgi:UDP-N-acetylmuramate dehydrogenase